jgi:hypothetical protein
MALGRRRLRLHTILEEHRRLLRKGPWSSIATKGQATPGMVVEVHPLHTQRSSTDLRFLGKSSEQVNVQNLLNVRRPGCP